MTPIAGILVGLLFGVGVLLAIAATPALRRPTLSERVLPYVLAPTARERIRDGQETERFMQTLLRRWAVDVDRWLGGRESLRRRLRRAGSDLDVDAFRVEQVVWALSSAGAAAALAVLIATSKGSVNPAPMTMLVGLAAVGGVLARERVLDSQVRRREALIVEQFPAVAEMLALAVAAGEGISGAIERVVERSSGPLAAELDSVLVDARMGTGMVQALRDLGDRTQVAELARFVDAIAVAVERGTPLAEVIRAQASDVRDAGRRSLMEAAGRKEIAMMVPVVFLVLPVTVVFALFPGFYGLTLNV